LADAIGRLKEENPVVMDFSPRKKRFLAMVPPGSNWIFTYVHLPSRDSGSEWCTACVWRSACTNRFISLDKRLGAPSQELLPEEA